MPAGYEIFRMGYYGLLTPHTAVAKSASDVEWARGGTYFWDFVGYYWLWLPLLVVAGCAVWLLRGARGRRLAIVLLTAGCALVHVLYVLRVGGDFMHGRMLLLPLFSLQVLFASPTGSEIREFYPLFVTAFVFRLRRPSVLLTSPEFFFPGFAFERC